MKVFSSPSSTEFEVYISQYSDPVETESEAEYDDEVPMEIDHVSYDSSLASSTYHRMFGFTYRQIRRLSIIACSALRKRDTSISLRLDICSSRS
jgi:hypothetical protein